MPHKIITGVVLLSVLLSTLVFPFSQAEAAVPVDLAGIDPGPILQLIQAFAVAMGYPDISVNTLNQDVDDLKQLITFFNTCDPPMVGLPPLFARNCLRQIVELLVGNDPIFQFNLFNAMFTREQDFIKTFELQKIEKAREDVNKLIFEVETELVDQGTIINQPDPLTGAEHIIKKPGRIIHNLDDFIYEEPIQKARDFIYCYFGGDLSPSVIPWKILPLGDTDPESIAKQRNLRNYFLSYIQRKSTYPLTAPPEEWYTEEVCAQIMASFPATEACFDNPNDPACASVTSSQVLPTLEKSLSRIRTDRGYFTVDEFVEYATNPNNSEEGIKTTLKYKIDGIIGQISTLRTLEYLAGQGVRSEKVLIGQPVPGTTDYYFFDTEYVISPAVILLQKMQAAAQSQFDLAQNAWVDLDTGTPSSILGNYNLKLGADVPILDSRGDPVVTLPGWIKPDPSLDTLQFRTTTDPSLATTLPGLPAPWEDTSSYNKLPLTQEGKVPSYDPREYMIPRDNARTFGSDPVAYMGNINLLSGVDPHRQRALFPSYRWFIDVTEMYERATRYGIRNSVTSANVGWNLLLKKWFGQEDAIDWNTVFTPCPGCID